MNNLNALGCFMNYCNMNMGKDKYVTQERFEAGSKVILSSYEGRFSACKTERDVLNELHWPSIKEDGRMEPWMVTNES